MRYVKAIAEQDTIPVEVDWAPGLYADWITRDMVEEIQAVLGHE